MLPPSIVSPTRCAWCYDGSPCPNHATVRITEEVLSKEIHRISLRGGLFGPSAPEEDAMCEKATRLLGRPVLNRARGDVLAALAADHLADLLCGIRADRVVLDDVTGEASVWGARLRRGE